MKICKASPLTGKVNAMEIPVDRKKYEAWAAARARGERTEVIQKVFPELTADQREFLMTGYTPEDWAKIFPPGSDE